MAVRCDHTGCLMSAIGNNANGNYCSKHLSMIQRNPLPQESGAAQPAPKPLFPESHAERKEIPIATGLLDYFPSALIEVAKVSFQGNKQHNPGEPLHWARGKSTDQADTIIRHLMERGTVDTDGMRHSAKAAWRALALLQLELEAEGAPKARNAQ